MEVKLFGCQPSHQIPEFLGKPTCSWAHEHSGPPGGFLFTHVEQKLDTESQEAQFRNFNSLDHVGVFLNWRGADTFVPGADGAVDRTSYLACPHDMLNSYPFRWIHGRTGKDGKHMETYWSQKKIGKSKAKFSAKFGIPDQLELR